MLSEVSSSTATVFAPATSRSTSNAGCANNANTTATAATCKP